MRPTPEATEDRPRSSARRERARAATIEEIKSAALTLMRDSGSTDVRFADIARALEMTPPALYRYFADRDQLLTVLIGDAYRDLADHLGACAATAAPGRAGARVTAVLTGFRSWAAADPRRFTLIFGPPSSSYAAPAGAPSTDGARRSMAALESALAADRTDATSDPVVTEVAGGPDGVLGALFRATRTVADDPLPAATYQAMLHSWIAVHGFVSLEIFGHLDWMPAPGRDALFDGQLRLCLAALGLPAADGT